MSKTKNRQKKRDLQRRRLRTRSGASRPRKPGIVAARVTKGTISFRPKDFARLYVEGQSDQLSLQLLRAIKEFSEYIFVEEKPKDQLILDMLAESLLYVFTKADYLISPQYQKAFTLFMPATTNLIAISRFRTTDPQIEILLDQPNSAAKILALYSARNRVQIDRAWLFDQAPELASLWYSRYLQAASTCGTQTVYQNLIHHLQNMDDRYDVQADISTSPIFCVTYVCSEMEREVKEIVNASVKRRMAKVAIRNNPKPRSIAILTDRWRPVSSVYRGLWPFVKALTDKYELTLVQLRETGKEPECEGFREVRHVKMGKGKNPELDSIMENDFRMAFYPDVGMNVESLYLSNIRIAPIQVMAYGHPSSTWGSEIDYVLGGTEMEPAENAEENYSERLVMIPGGAVFPTIPSYQPTHPEKSDSEIVVNCVWNTAKCNWPLLMTLTKILDRTDRKVIFQFLPSMVPMRMNSYLAFKRDIESEVGPENVRVVPTHRDTYMQALEKGDFSIDSYPFGGFTSIVDALHVGKPMVTWQGNRAYNISASRLMRKAGLDELVATSEDEYVEKICRLIQDDEYRRQLAERIEKLDLQEALFDPKETEYFVKAIDYLMENHESLQAQETRAPIVISP